MLIVGIDEAGRGPLAGPLSVAAVAIFSSATAQEFLSLLKTKDGKLKDSKKLTEKRREEIFDLLIKSKGVVIAHKFVSSSIIDKKGIRAALDTASKSVLEQILKKADIDKSQVKVLMDASLSVPEEFEQESIKKGDELVLEIALASVVAKVKRDKHMIKLSKKYPEYLFDFHKGYGTKKHIEAIKKYGLIPEHRKTFIHL